MAYIYRTFGTPTNNKIWTISVWVKDSGLTDQAICGAKASAGSGTPEQTIGYTASKLYWTEYSGSGYPSDLYTNHLMRDPGAWKHIVYATDTTQSTASDRAKFYINGVRVTPGGTEWSIETYPAEDANTYWNQSGYSCNIGEGGTTTGSDNWKGLMSHFQFVDGVQLAPTEFGETDATSGIWKLKTGAYATPGTNGFFLKFEDSSNLDLDSSSNAHTFTTSGTLTATKDNPSNNFATFNPLDNYYPGSTFSNGNNSIVTGASPRYAPNTATMGLVSGKWYWETKCTVGGTDSWTQGIQSSFSTSTSNAVGDNANDYAYFANGQTYTGGSGSAYGDTYTVDDIIGNYLDLDNNKMYWAKNGTVQNSGTGISITAPASTLKGAYFPAVSDWSSAQTYTYHLNFGNGYFGTTVITSPQDDAGGVGAFKYDPSTGTFDSASKDFRAICTKNIKAYG